MDTNEPIVIVDDGYYDGGDGWSFPNRWHFHCFVAATSFCIASGIFLLLYPARDFFRCYVLNWHIMIGAADAVFAALTLMSFLREMCVDRRPWTSLLPTALIQILPFAEMTFFVSWAAGLGTWAITSKKYCRIHSLLFTVVFASGMYLAGPCRFTLRTDFFLWNHAAAGLACVVWMLFAMRAVAKHREETGETSRRAIAAGAFLLLFVGPASLVFSMALRDNARFALPPRTLQRGYSFSVDSGAKLKKPKTSPAMFMQDSATCGTADCHPDIYKQWRASTHRFAASNIPYRKMVAEFADEFGWEAASLCARCHSPMTVVYGLPDRPGEPIADVLRDEGISCQYCHSITGADPEAGNGNVKGVLRPAHLAPLKVPMRGDERTRQRFLSFDIVSHRNDFNRNYMDGEQQCASCHRAVIPLEFTEGHKLVLGDSHTPWVKSRDSHGLSCVGCHMPLSTYFSKVHAHGDHRMFGINQALSRTAPPGAAPDELLREFDRDAVLWLQGKLPVPEYEVWFLRLIRHEKYRAFEKFTGRPAAAGLAVEGSVDKSSNTAKLSVTVSNNTLSHNFPASPLDLTETWVEVTAADAGGAAIFRNCGAGNAPDGSATCLELGGVPVDASGRPIEKHHFWDAKKVEKRVVIPPGESLKRNYEIKLPPGAKRPITITARCMYRRYKQKLNTWIYGENSKPFPATELSRAQAVIR